MGLLSELSTRYKTISIVGMAKNAGKTTALNYLIEEAEDESIRLGITSTGRDGETTDLVTNTDKPRVYLYEDTIVSVPTQLYELAEAGLEILSMSKYRTRRPKASLSCPRRERRESRPTRPPGSSGRRVRATPEAAVDRKSVV